MKWKWLAQSFVLLTCTCARVQAQQPPSVAGRVTDWSGVPIEAALVELVELGLFSLTDASGSFRLRVAAGGAYTLRVTGMGWVTRTVRLELNAPSETRLIIQLAPQPLSVAPLTVEAGTERTILVDRAELERSGALTMADALARLPGVVVNQPIPGGAQQISIRGSAASQVLVLVDGVAINDPITGAADLSRIPVGSVERIELVPGAGSARYGARALAGVLIVETRRSAASPALDVSGGSLGLRRGNLVTGGGRAIGWSAGASWRALDGEFDFTLPDELGGDSRTRVNADSEDLDAFASVSAGLLGGDLRTRVGFQSETRGLPGRGYAPSPDARQGLRLARVASSWESSGLDHALRISVGLQQQRNLYADRNPPFGMPYDDTVDVAVAELRAEAERRLRATTFGFGLDSRVQHIETSTLQESFRQPGQFGAFTHAARMIATGPLQLGLNAQLRVDHDRTQGQQYASHSLTVLARWAAVAAHVAHRSGYAPPALGDQFFREAVGVQPNPALRAERVRELELGLTAEQRVGPAALELSANAFTGNIRDLIVWAPDFRFIWSPQNEDVLRDGVELSAAARLGENWRGAASFARTRITYDRIGRDDDGIQVVYRPRHTGAFTLERRGERWDARLEAAYIGRRNTSPNELNSLPPFWTTAALATIRFAAWRIPAAVQLRVDRALDEEDALIFGFPNPGRVLTATLRLGGSTDTREK